MWNPDDPRSQVRSLRQSQINAINSLDYDRAQELQDKIDNLRRQPRRSDSPERAVRNPTDVNAQRIRAQQKRDLLLQDLRGKFKPRFLEMDSRHAKEQEALQTELSYALMRERLRPVPEADTLLARSKLLARNRQFQYANELMNQAKLTRDRTMRRRLKACRATFREERRKLCERQANELELMNEKIDFALQKIYGQHAFFEHVIDNHARINDFKRGVWPPDIYTLGPFHQIDE
jgi:hypothetical protein